MGLDILLFRNPATLDLVRESQRRRYKNPKDVDDVLSADDEWRSLQFVCESSRRCANDCSKEIGNRKKAEAKGKKNVPSVSEGDTTNAPVSIPENVLTEAKEGRLDKESLKALSARQIMSLAKVFQERVAELQAAASAVVKRRDSLLINIGNIVHESVPVHDDEDVGNTVVRTFGKCARDLVKHKLNHVDIMSKLGGMDTSKTVTSMAGGRAYVLRGSLVHLQLALINYGVQFLSCKGYVPFYPPFFLLKEVMSEVAQLSQFDDELYKITEKSTPATSSPVTEGTGGSSNNSSIDTVNAADARSKESNTTDDKYLIATSEMPIAAYHRDKWYTEQQLTNPIKYAGVSSCFRKEAGSHGRDTLGIFRVHQFDKIEQFLICPPRDNASWILLEEMIKTSEEFCQSLGLPYRVVNICSGALNNAAAKKYDLEGFFPGSSVANENGTFRELVSCSNCTDYQSRALNCRYGAVGKDKDKDSKAEKEYTHMLNGTLCAVTRVMCCICENFQCEEGVVIPEKLRPFMMGKEMLRYDEASKMPY